MTQIWQSVHGCLRELLKTQSSVALDCCPATFSLPTSLDLCVSSLPNCGPFSKRFSLDLQWQQIPVTFYPDIPYPVKLSLPLLLLSLEFILKADLQAEGTAKRNLPSAGTLSWLQWSQRRSEIQYILLGVPHYCRGSRA